jgi:hypothetical protein
MDSLMNCSIFCAFQLFYPLLTSTYMKLIRFIEIFYKEKWLDMLGVELKSYALFIELLGQMF